MAGPYTGAWQASAISETQYTGAAKWGTGVNPVHSVYGAGVAVRQIGTKVDIYPEVTTGGQDTDIIDEDFAWDGTLNNPDPYLPPYNVSDSEIWGYGSQTGTSDRPVWGMEMADSQIVNNAGGLPNPVDTGPVLPIMRGRTQNDTNDKFPSWGGSRKTKPGGTFIRQLRRGAARVIFARQLPNEDVAQGWENKAHGISPDSKPSDDSQIFIQTSDVQRRKVRAGSQRSGSQSDYSAPIASRETGQKLKVFAASDSSRHWDMYPYDQVDYVRPFLSRQAGTGYREWLDPNAMYVSPAIQREPAPDPQLGAPAGSGGENYVDEYAYNFVDGYYG